MVLLPSVALMMTSILFFVRSRRSSEFFPQAPMRSQHRKRTGAGLTLATMRFKASFAAPIRPSPVEAPRIAWPVCLDTALIERERKAGRGYWQQ